MKKQKIAAILGITIGAMWVSGCASTQNKEYAGKTVYGEVSELGTNSVTIELGTQKEMEKPEDATDTTDSGTAEQSEESKSADGDKADGEKPDGEAPSMLDLTGETLKVTVSSDTEIVSSGMAGGPGGAPGGEAPSGEAPEKPDGWRRRKDSADDRDLSGKCAEIHQRMWKDRDSSGKEREMGIPESYQ